MLDDIGTFRHAGISPEDLTTALTGFCDIGSITTVTEIEEGVNVTAEVTTPENKYFVKLHTFNRDEDVFYAQPFILQYLTDNSDLSVPTPVGYDFSHSSLEYSLYVTEFVDGEVLASDQDSKTEQQARTVGTVLGKINSIQTTGYGYTVPPKRDGQECDIQGELPFNKTNWDAEFTKATEELLATADSRFYDLYDSLQDYLESNTARTVTPHLLHFDFWWENLLWDGETPTVIDWERAVGGDPLANRILSEHYLFDSISIDTDYSFGGDTHKENLRNAFRDAYEDAYSGSVPLDADDETQDLYELLLYIRELRGFPYWWRNETEDWKEKRENALRAGIAQYL